MLTELLVGWEPLAYTLFRRLARSEEAVIGGEIGSQVRDLMARVRSAVGDRRPLRFQFHKTRNTGFANALAALLDG